MGHHAEMQWARKAGGTNTQIAWSVNVEQSVVFSNVTVMVWSADTGYLPMLKGLQVISQYENGQLTGRYTSKVDRPLVERMEKSTSAGTLPQNPGVSWTESSDQEVRLFTGGDERRQGMALFNLSASLTCDTELDPGVHDWGEAHPVGGFLSAAVPPMAVPPQHIALGTVGKLGSDGHRYTVQSSGNERVITPTAPAVSSSGNLPWVTKHVLVSHALPQALTNPDPERTKLGGGEEVSIYFDPELEMPFPETPWWLAFDGSVWPNVGSEVNGA